jgi:hypothetical protein
VTACAALSLLYLDFAAPYLFIQGRTGFVIMRGWFNPINSPCTLIPVSSPGTILPGQRSFVEKEMNDAERE